MRARARDVRKALRKGLPGSREAMRATDPQPGSRTAVTAATNYAVVIYVLSGELGYRLGSHWQLPHRRSRAFVDRRLECRCATSHTV